jgi:hypothetical protein
MMPRVKCAIGFDVDSRVHLTVFVKHLMANTILDK